METAIQRCAVEKWRRDGTSALLQVCDSPVRHGRLCCSVDHDYTTADQTLLKEANDNMTASLRQLRIVLDARDAILAIFDRRLGQAGDNLRRHHAYQSRQEKDEGAEVELGPNLKTLAIARVDQTETGERVEKWLKGGTSVTHNFFGNVRNLVHGDDCRNDEDFCRAPTRKDLEKCCCCCCCFMKDVLQIKLFKKTRSGWVRGFNNKRSGENKPKPFVAP